MITDGDMVGRSLEYLAALTKVGLLQPQFFLYFIHLSSFFFLFWEKSTILHLLDFDLYVLWISHSIADKFLELFAILTWFLRLILFLFWLLFGRPRLKTQHVVCWLHGYVFHSTDKSFIVFDKLHLSIIFISQPQI